MTPTDQPPLQGTPTAADPPPTPLGRLVVFALLLVAGYACYEATRSSRQAADQRHGVGQPAPDLTLRLTDGRTVQLSSFKGKKVVLDFWATWCGPCRKEIPHFIALTERYKDELVVVGISDEPAEVVRAFAERHGVNYPMATGRGWPKPFDAVQGYPTTYFLDKEGVVRAVEEGYCDRATLEQAIRGL